MNSSYEILDILSINNQEYKIYYQKKKHYQRNTYYHFKGDYFLITSYYKINKAEAIEVVKKYALKLYKKGYLASKNELEIHILGKSYKINNNSIIYKNKLVNLNELDEFLIKDLYAILLERFEFYRNLMEVDSSYFLTIKNMKSCYGSNSRKTHKISLSTMLFPYSLEIINAVIVHELAHCYYFNHSKDFYNIVFKYCPNYKFLHQKLRRKIYQ